MSDERWSATTDDGTIWNFDGCKTYITVPWEMYLDMIGAHTGSPFPVLVLFPRLDRAEKLARHWRYEAPHRVREALSVLRYGATEGDD